MRILAAIASVDARQGGPVESLKNIHLALRERGHETEVVSCDDPSASFLHAFPLPVHAMGPRWNRYGYTPRLARWVAANRQRFDVAVLRGLWNHAPAGAWLDA